MFKISHEVPLELLQKSLEFNDYDYCLGHLYDANTIYRQFYKAVAWKERHIILDNSAYELGEPLKGAAYLSIIEDLEPDEYIIPDIRDSASKNLQAAEDWLQFAGVNKVTSRAIAVVHGENYKAFCKNYLELSKLVSKIAFSFESFFKRLAEQKKITLAEARISILKEMVKDGVIDTTKSHHILGALSPTEFKSYMDYSWIETVDTSNPVLHGMLGLTYKGEEGLTEKSSAKMADLIEQTLSREEISDVLYNVKWFRDQFKRRDEVLVVGITPKCSSDLEKEVQDIVRASDYDYAKADHYRKQPIETIEIMRRVYGESRTADWCEITAFKYRMRLGYKPKTPVEEDLKKEKWYLDRAEELRENLV